MRYRKIWVENNCDNLKERSTAIYRMLGVSREMTMGMMKLMIATLLVSSTAAKDSPTFLDLLKSYGIGSHNIRSLSSPTSSKYDFIVVGAGSGGSTVANRLSENPQWKILLLEAGKPEGFFNQIPLIVSLFQQSDYNWGYRVQPQKNACLGMKDRRCTWPRGKSLGGTSTINYMVHTRGNKLDFDEWASLGNIGWSYEQVLPYFKKSEHFNVPGITNSSYHGTDGYLCVEHVPYRTVLASEFLKAGKERGYKITDDYNGAEQLGFSYLQVNMESGARCSASKAYLTGNRSNLDIVTEARVTRVLIDENKRAYGVEYIKNGAKAKVYASKEVILSAGTIDSAKLLMLSGIGPRDHLRHLGIKVIKDSKVGYNLYEHIGFLGLTFMANQSVTLLQKTLETPSLFHQYIDGRNGPLSLAGGAESLAFIRTKYAPDARPDIELVLISASLHSDGGAGLRIGMGVTDELYNAVYKPIEGKDAWSIWMILQKPQSHGRIKLKSRNPLEAPLLQPNLFSHPADIKIVLEGVKHAISISRTAAFRAYGSEIHDIKIPGCKNFAFGTDRYWTCAIKHLTLMGNHEIGTVKMGPAWDENAVVDPQLRVYGVRGLRVVDASIMPTMPIGHVNAVIYMIGEKAADMIKSSWR